MLDFIFAVIVACFFWLLQQCPYGVFYLRWIPKTCWMVVQIALVCAFRWRQCMRPMGPNVDYRRLPPEADDRQPSGACAGWMPALLNPVYWGDPPLLVSEESGELRRCTSTKLLVWAGAIAGWFLVIATHFHYSIDVLLAVILTVGSWNLYHSYVRGLDLRLRTHTLWLLSNRFFSWFERDAPDIPLRAAIYNSRFSRRYHDAAHPGLFSAADDKGGPEAEFKQKFSPRLAEPPSAEVARMDYHDYLRNGGAGI